MCMHTHPCMHTHARMYARTHTHSAHTHRHSARTQCTHTRAHTCIHTHTHTCMHVCTYRVCSSWMSPWHRDGRLRQLRREGKGKEEALNITNYNFGMPFSKELQFIDCYCTNTMQLIRKGCLILQCDRCTIMWQDDHTATAAALICIQTLYLCRKDLWL